MADRDPIFDSPYAWMRLGITLLIGVMGNTGMWVITVILPEVQDTFDASRGAASMPYVLTMVGFALGNLLIGKAVDRWGVTTALTGAAVIISAGYGLAMLAPSMLVLSLLQLAIGFGTAASFGPLIADLSRWFQKRRGIAVAVAACGNYLSGAVWPVLLGWFAADEGWRWSYGALAVLTLITMLPLAQLLRRRVPADALAVSSQDVVHSIHP